MPVMRMNHGITKTANIFLPDITHMRNVRNEYGKELIKCSNIYGTYGI